MLIPRPFLKRSEAEPGGRAVLVLVVDWMAGCQMMIGIEIFEPSSRQMGPQSAAVTIQIVSEIPGNIGEGSEAGNRIVDEAALVRAIFGRVNTTIIHVEDQRNNHVPVARIAQGTVKLLPVRNIKTGVIKSRVIRIRCEFRRPRGDENRPVCVQHYWLAVKTIAPAGNGDPYTIDFQSVQTLDAELNDGLVIPAHQPVRRGPVEEVVFASAFPDEMPRVLGINTDGAPNVPIRRVKIAGASSSSPALVVVHGGFVIARNGSHKAD